MNLVWFLPILFLPIKWFIFNKIMYERDEIINLSLELDTNKLGGLGGV